MRRDKYFNWVWLDPALMLYFLIVLLVASSSLGVESTPPRRSSRGAAAGINNSTRASSLGHIIGRTGRSSSTTTSSSTSTSSSTTRSRISREQYLFNVFEVIVSTLETKLQRIENLDKAVEHLMRRVEGLDSRVTDNIDKTESVIDRLRSLDNRLTEGSSRGSLGSASANLDSGGEGGRIRGEEGESSLDKKLVLLDRKVSDIDSKLVGLKNQLEGGNFLNGEDFNAEASEKKPISANLPVNEKVLIGELESLRGATGSLDRKLQFHINLVSENLGRLVAMTSDIHEAVVEPVVVQSPPPPTVGPQARGSRSNNSTLPTPKTIVVVKSSKLDKLARQMNPMLSVSNKMDEVWNVVVGTKSSVDDLVPKSNELLTQTQRQERAINDIHADLRTNTNKIIANLDLVERRLKKQEEDVVGQRPSFQIHGDSVVSSAPGVDVYPLISDSETPLPSFQSQQQEPLGTDIPPSLLITTTQSSNNNPSPSQQPTGASSTTTITSTSSPSQYSSSSSPQQRIPSPQRNRGVIFPSVKNKPSPANTSFITDQLAPAIRDVKGYSCLDLMNAGMKQSGVYYLQIRGTTYWFLKVYCEQDIAEGGWTVIQRRDDVGEPRENFNRDWADYKNGFGDPAKEFWLGNENIYMLTNNEEYMLRVELEDFEGNRRYAQYSHFKIYSEGEYYKLEIDGYEGNAGDSLNDPWYGSNNSPFSTYNRDNDRSSLNCASMLKGGWWWKSCGRGLNGLYLNDPQDITARQGIVWFRWRGWDYTLKKASMMIKPKAMINQT